MKNLYKTGLVIGRFQPIHKGHEFIIKQALTLCNKVYVYIGSSQESNTWRNPFSFDLRKELISKVFSKEVRKKRLIIKPLADIGVGDTLEWGQYVMDTIRTDLWKGFDPSNHEDIDLYVTGCEKARASWFSNAITPNMSELRVARKNLEIADLSGRACRKTLMDEDFYLWCCLVPKALGNYKYYCKLKEIYKNVKG